MFESLSQRTVIIGNSGAGKSALAESLAADWSRSAELGGKWLRSEAGWRCRTPNDARSFPPSRSGSLKVYMAGLPTSLFRGQQHSSGWIFHGTFAAPDYSHVVHAEEQRIRTTWSFWSGLRLTGIGRRRVRSPLTHECLPIFPAPNSDWRPENRRLYCSLTYVLAWSLWRATS